MPSTGAAPPALKQWQRDGVVRFLLVHGMGDHPFGLKANGQPELGDSPDYDTLAKHLRDLDRGEPNDELKRLQRAAAKDKYDDFIRAYASAAGLRERTAADGLPASFRFIYSKSSDRKTGDIIGYVFRREFEPASGSGHPVYFYASCWSIGSAVIKEKAYGSWNGLEATAGKVGEFEPIIDNPRESLNRKLKHRVVDWGLSDASLYLNAYRNGAEWAVASSMRALAEDLRDGERAVVVSSSLGSTVTFNVMSKLVANESIGGQQWEASPGAVTRLRRIFHPAPSPDPEKLKSELRIAFYMFANQYGLLTAGAFPGDAAAAAGEAAAVAPVAAARAAAKSGAAGTLSKTVQTAQSTMPRAERPRRGEAAVELVAFTDPDDLLSFAVPSSGDDFVKVTNVYVSNNKVSVAIPFVGSLANPAAAHLAYGTNPVVLKIMLDGAAAIRPRHP